ncbi:carbon-nitrogen hydrolase family protein [Moorella sulfitireducens]|uniref:carbon-nitrogen hydrolase family protein n=1 Tax=Neomoorella sulfitireducens TaxID=2972948 RepID=UPI0021AC580B|nr:carbon-nitrogen hydrolase family protein [Moorella sulfitireducens]
MELYKLSIIQFSPERTYLAKNLESMKRYLSMVPVDTHIILLPEAWLGTRILTWEEYYDNVLALHAVLQCPDALLVAGAQYVQVGQMVYSLGIAWSNYLNKPLIFEKIFPSHAVGERLHIASGSNLPVFDHLGLRLGVIICVDLFYPELVRSLALRGASLILNPASIPANRARLWQSIGITRASENTVFLAMTNNTNVHYRDGRKVEGQSFFAYPDGQTLLTCGQEPGVYSFTFSPSLIEQLRQRWPYIEDIKNNAKKLLDFYSV